MKYAPFKEAILSLLNDIDWQSLIDVSNPELQKELAEVEALIGKNEARLSRYNRMLDLDDEPPELLTFGATVLTAGPVKNVQGGQGKIVAKLTFANGAVKWAIIDKDRAVLLS